MDFTRIDYYKQCFGIGLCIPSQSSQSRNVCETTQEKDDRNLFALEFDKDMNEEENIHNK